ncbi:MAG TPA: RsiV family protein [Chitinophagaceae bacterium]|nr:RsiV family protein [Chitinophagaceae bacterium]
MKKFFLSMLFLSSAILTISQPAENWYKVFTGKVGNLATTVHLHKAGKIYNGYAWFEQNQTPMQLSSYNVPKTDSILISGTASMVSLVLTGILTATSFIGNSQLIKEGSPVKAAGFQLLVSNEKTFSPFNYYTAEANDTMPAQYKNYSQFNYFSSAVWPTGTKPLDESLKKFIRTSLGMKTPATETGKYLIETKNKLSKGWKAEYVRLTPKETAELGMSLSHHEENTMLVMHENEKLISLAFYSFLEAGGAAHGNYGTSVATFNKQSGKQLQLADILNPQGINLLPAILEQVARILYNAKNNKPLDQNGFFVKKITPNKNMYVTGSGIGFMYAPYEIKSFADGEINLLVPFTALKPYLLKSFQ